MKKSLVVIGLAIPLSSHAIEALNMDRDGREYDLSFSRYTVNGNAKGSYYTEDYSFEVDSDGHIINDDIIRNKYSYTNSYTNTVNSLSLSYRFNFAELGLTHSETKKDRLADGEDDKSTTLYIKKNIEHSDNLVSSLLSSYKDHNGKAEALDSLMIGYVLGNKLSNYGAELISNYTYNIKDGKKKRWRHT